ncbi:hypothetical protein T07_3031 [Trichinella nelsoni]|uniref:Uncharacterized protein n=1 Tax=Trichinella nelsoni TaxID=6336 RepID=A0A0V0RFQ6_9BILA|nr:hypothetical protein T07_3681 [Trichinella nelsoni]KRX13131.1 hypothetical protein T07_3031 [Trichinella nelsoni]
MKKHEKKLVNRSERTSGKIKFFCKPEIFSKNTTAEIRKYFSANIQQPPLLKEILMTSKSNCWLTFLLNSIFPLAWINKSESFRKQKESDEQHQRSTKALEAALNSLCSGHRQQKALVPQRISQSCVRVQRFAYACYYLMSEATVSGHSMEYSICLPFVMSNYKKLMNQISDIIRNLPAEIVMDTAFRTGRQ